MKPYQMRDRDVKILELKTAEFTHQEIAAKLDISVDTVQDTVNKFKGVFKQLDKVAAFRTAKSDILAAAQLAALESAFSGNKLAKASFMSTLSGFEILNKAERLNNGQSSENIEHKVFGTIGIKNE